MSYDAFISYSHASDAQLAPALQRALHRFAKPWYKLRQLHVFRDATSLTANPGLWSAIEAALNESRWFLLIGCPGAANSQWVRKEVTWWLANRKPEKLLIVLSDGEIAWDNEAKDFDWAKTSALPDVLRKEFVEEPLFVDLRWTRADADLSTSSPRFLDAVATLAAPLNGKAKEELIGEDFSQHRGLKRIVGMVIALLTTLTVFAGHQWYQAVQQRKEATAQALAFRSNDLRERKSEAIAKLVAALSLDIRPTQAAKDVAIQLFAAQPAFSIPLVGHTRGVTGVAFSPDGGRIVSGSWDNTIRLWDARTGKPIGPPIYANPASVQVSLEAAPGDPNQGWVQCVAFSPDGKRIVSAGNDAKLRFWDVTSRQLVGTPLAGHEGAVTSLAFSEDGLYVVSGSYDTTVRLWDVNAGKQIGSPLIGHTAAVTAVAFSRDGTRVASAGDQTVRLWNARTGKPLGAPLKGDTGDIFGVVFTPDGKRIVTAGDRILRVWEVDTGTPIGEPMVATEGRLAAVAVSNDGRRIVSGDGNGVRLWNLDTGEPIGAMLTGHEEQVVSVAFSADGTRIVSGSEDNTVRIWNTELEKPFGIPLTGSYGAVTSVAFSQDSKRIVGLDERGMKWWDARTGQLIPYSSACTVMANSFAISADGTRVVGTLTDHLSLCDAQTGQEIGKAMRASEAMIMNVAFSPDSRRIVSAGGDRMLRIWDAQTQEQIGPSLAGHTEPVYAVAFSPDGARIVSGSADQKLRLWDANTGQPIGAPWAGHTQLVSSVAFSPSGNYVASGSQDNTVRLWDARTGKSLGDPLVGHGSWISSVAFSADSKRIVSGSFDGTVRLWDVQTRSAIGRPLLGHKGGVQSVAFSADGKRLATGGSDHLVRLWDAEALVSADVLHGLLCASAYREMTTDEWVLNVPAIEPYRDDVCGKNKSLKTHSPPVTSDPIFGAYL